MDITGLQQVVLAILVLLFVTVIMAGIFTGVVWAFAKVIKWILNRKPVQRWVSATQRRMEAWWGRHRVQMERRWEALFHLIVDPLLFTYVLFALYDRLSSLTDYINTHPEYNFWQLLNVDMGRSMTLYIWFILIFYVWMLGKIWVHNQERREHRAVAKALEANTQILQSVNETLKMISNKLGIQEAEPSGITKDDSIKKGE